MMQGRPVTVDVHNQSPDAEIVHWHGLFLPPETDGAAEEGSPMIAPGASTRIAFTPDPAGFRWFHTHTFAGSDMRKGQYGGQHGLLMIDSSDPADAANQPAFDREVFLALHDFGGREMPSADGSAMPEYEVATINGKMLGFGEPLRVKQGERILMHVLNSSPTEAHWIALAGHTFQVVALDGNPVPHRRTVAMLRLAPAERVSALVQIWTRPAYGSSAKCASTCRPWAWASCSNTPTRPARPSGRNRRTWCGTTRNLHCSPGTKPPQSWPTPAP